MKKVSVKIPAKVNLTFDILGEKDGYHEIDSLFCSVDLYDKIILKKRKDNKIIVKNRGFKLSVPSEKSNAYLAAQKVNEILNLKGLTAVIKRKIPIGAGLGSSSADAAGVIVAASCYKKGINLEETANKFGSDTAFMLKGGFAEVTGRGEKIKHLRGIPTFYGIVLTAKYGRSAKEGYSAYDANGKTYLPVTKTAVELLKNGNSQEFFSILKNDLYLGEDKKFAEITENLVALKEVGAKGAVMTGSGSAVIGIFSTKKERNAAYKKLPKSYKKKAIKVQTL